MSNINAERTQRSSIGGLLKNKDFRFLWIGGGLDNAARWMDILVLGLLVLELTDSPWQVALMFVFRWMPMLVFAIFSGMIADRYNRWRVMMLARAGAVAVTVGVLVLLMSDAVETWHLLLVSLALGWMMVLEFPSRRSLIYDLVGVRLISNAMSLETINSTIGRFVGPLGAGIMIEFVGFTVTYMALLVGYILAFISIGLVSTSNPSRTAGAISVWKNISEGVHYSYENIVIRSVLAITLIMNALAFSLEALFPVVARDHLHVGTGLTGILISAQAIGTLFAAFFIAAMRNLRYHGRVFCFGVTLQFVSLLLFAFSPWYAISFLLLMMLGVGSAGFGTMQSTIILISSVPSMRGTTLGVLGQCIGVAALGGLVLGAVADVFSAQVAVAIGASLGLVLLAPVLLLSPLLKSPIRSAEDDGQVLQDVDTHADTAPTSD